MGQLYDYCQQIQEHIDRNNLDVFRTRGALALECGFIPTLITPSDPDDQQRIQALRDAAQSVLGLTLK